jgi:hypothetical protein
MRSWKQPYQIEALITEHLGHLSSGQRRGLALWVYGTILARSGCESAVLAALLTLGRLQSLRQRLRDWLRDGGDKAAPCQSEVDTAACFGPLLRWIVAWWVGDRLPLALDATTYGTRWTVLVVSVLYRGCAMPVAWQVLPGNTPGGWLEPITRLFDRLAPAVPREWLVVVLADRGLWSPRIWGSIRAQGWHPLLRLQVTSTFQPDGHPRQAARAFVPQPGRAWLGTGRAFHPKHKRVAGTLIVIWAVGQADPWVLLTDLPPAVVGPSWYALRFWIELGFRALKAAGWQWEHTRRTDQTRVARHWLVLAVATLLTLAYGSRAEDADRLRCSPDDLLVPPPPDRLPPLTAPRRISLFRVGLAFLLVDLAAASLWSHLWLAPDPWPSTPSDILVSYHLPCT